MINWILIIYLSATSPEYEIWGGYKTLEACQKSLDKLEYRYKEKRKEFNGKCYNVKAVQLENKQ